VEASAGMLWPNRRGGRVMSTTPIRVRQTLTALNKPQGSFRKSRANIATNTGTLNTTTCNRMYPVHNQYIINKIKLAKAMVLVVVII
jgi:hypothetical protein